LKPVKRRGNRRYYQRQDVILIRQIKSLLYEQGYTIGGARQKMSDSPEDLAKSNVNASEIRSLVKDLESVIAQL
jgi:DNA-binding transcriptional MerR regulator